MKIVKNILNHTVYVYFCNIINLGEKSGESKGSRTLTKVTFDFNKKGSSTIDENSTESPKKSNIPENR
jgi:hypothetical protein